MKINQLRKSKTTPPNLIQHSRNIVLAFFTALLITNTINSNAEPQKHATLSLSGFYIFENRLSDVVKKFGGNLVEKKTTDTYTVSVCYVLKNDQLLVRFMSGEQGGNEKLLQGFEIALLDQPPPDECERLSSYRAFHLTTAIRSFKIGMTRKEYSQAIDAMSGHGVKIQRAGANVALFNRQAQNYKTVFDVDFHREKMTRIKLWTSLEGRD